MITASRLPIRPTPILPALYRPDPLSSSGRFGKSPWVFVIVLCSLLITLALPRHAGAQSYRFEVTKMEMHVHVETDASVQIHYAIVFKNDPKGHAIDVVDVGLPHNQYDVHTMTASLDGHPVKKIRPSEYIAVGVECHLGATTIQPGQSARFEFECVMPDLVYQDTTDSNYASLQIRPTWFDSSSYRGTTHLAVGLHMLPGVNAQDLRFQEEDRRYSGLAQWGKGTKEHVVAYWEFEEFALSSKNPKFSVSFPQRGMQRVVVKTNRQLFLEWLASARLVRFISAAALVVAYCTFYFRFAGGTGCVLFFSGLAGILLLAVVSPGMHLLCWPVVLCMLGVNEWYLQSRDPDSYLPAMATVEGGGIKRGLTAPQAAVLLEQPMGKVLTMVLFGLLKKNVLTMVASEPLEVKVAGRYVAPREKRRAEAATNGVVLHDYEHPFLDLLQAASGPVEKCDLSDALRGLIDATADRMSGFDLERTRAYYRRIIDRAWKDAESIGEVKVRDEVVERNFEWMMMDEDWRDLFEGWSGRGYTYYPTWGRTIFPSGPSLPRSHASRSSPAPSSGSSSSNAPTFGEVASSFFGWAENTSGRLASSIDGARVGLPSASSAIDLTAIDVSTKKFFDALVEASQSSGGGGGGGGCACACAGCACACACAGGGR